MLYLLCNMTCLYLFNYQEGEETEPGEHPISPTHSQIKKQSGGPSNSAIQSDHFCVNAKVTVYAALSGMVSFLPDGTIYGCNHHFAVMLLGYSQEELLKKV